MSEQLTVLHLDSRKRAKQGSQAGKVAEGKPDSRWLSYDEIAERTGLSHDAVTWLVRGSRWTKRAGNVAGEFRVAVPASAMSDLMQQAPSDEAWSDIHAMTGGLPGPTRILNAIHRRFERLEVREDRLGGELREKFEQEQARSDVAEAALQKAGERLERYQQALDTMQIAVAARSAAEDALVAAGQRLELLTTATELERALAAENLLVRDEEARQAADQLAAMIAARDAAETALSEAIQRQSRSDAAADAEHARLEAIAAEERTRSSDYVQQLAHAAGLIHVSNEQRKQAEECLADTMSQLEQVRDANAAERAQVEAQFAEQLQAAELALADSQQAALLVREAASADQAQATVAREECLRTLETLHGVEQAAQAEIAALLAGHAVAVVQLERWASQEAAARQCAEAAQEASEAALAAAVAEVEALRQATAAEHADVDPAIMLRLADAERAQELAGVARAHSEAQVQAQADALVEANGMIAAIANEAAAQRAQLEAQLAERSAELLSSEARAQEAAVAAALAHSETVNALASLAHRAQAAEMEAVAERKRAATIVEDERDKADCARAALAAAEARGDRAMGQVEAERVHAKQAVMRAAQAETALSALMAAPARSFRARVAALIQR